MRIDINLVREILLKIAELDDGYGNGVCVFSSEMFPSHSDSKIYGHLKALEEKGLIEGTCIPDTENGDIEWFEPKRLTWDGQDFLGKIEDDGIWQDVKNSLKKAPSVITLEILTTLASSATKAVFGINS